MTASRCGVNFIMQWQRCDSLQPSALKSHRVTIKQLDVLMESSQQRYIAFEYPLPKKSARPEPNLAFPTLLTLFAHVAHPPRTVILEHSSTFRCMPSSICIHCEPAGGCPLVHLLQHNGDRYGRVELLPGPDGNDACCWS